jgi:hypothetical protein
MMAIYYCCIVVRDYLQIQTGHTTSMREYIVKAGDTLYEIAKREYGSYGMMEQIRTDNNLANPNRIYVGQRLKIREAGDLSPKPPVTPPTTPASNGGTNPTPPTGGGGANPTPPTMPPTVPGPIEGGMLIDMPYYSQIGKNADWGRNDCGPSCIRMMIGWHFKRQGKPDPADITVDSLYQQLNVGTDGYTGWTQLTGLAAGHGLTLQFSSQATVPNLRREIDAGRPALVLVLYSHVKDRQSRYTGGHYLVVVGYTTNTVIVHDPLFYAPRAKEGRNRHIPLVEFEAAQKAAPNPYFRYPNQALLVKS